MFETTNLHIMWLKQQWITHLGMVYTTYKNGDDWGMVYCCFNHINGEIWEYK
jgi:hypothetical protein